MQHRYQVMRHGPCRYSAQIEAPDGEYAIIKYCTTRWGAIWACKAEARTKVQAVSNTNPVWSATLPMTAGQQQAKIEADNAALNR